jgi:hypothetical protein
MKRYRLRPFVISISSQELGSCDLERVMSTFGKGLKLILLFKVMRLAKTLYVGTSNTCKICMEHAWIVVPTHIHGLYMYMQQKMLSAHRSLRNNPENVRLLALGTAATLK